MKQCISIYDGTMTEDDLDQICASHTQDGLMSKEDKIKLDNLAGGGDVSVSDPSKIVQDATHRFVTDTEKSAWNNKASKDTASTNTNGLMSKEDKIKLDSIETEANKYVHPESHPATMIIEDNNHKFVTADQINSWNSMPKTKEDIDLGNVTNDAQVKRSEMGTANGVATLDDSGLIPSSQLPGFVDDVLEAASVADFPNPGESGKLYVDTTENKTYRWSGTQYVEIVSGGVTLGETSATAYAGDKGKSVCDRVDNILNGTTLVPKSQSSLEVNGFKVEANVPADAKFTDTVYVHPESHPAEMIVESTDKKFATTAQLVKVDTIPDDPKYTDTVYTHPENHPATMIIEDETHKFVTAEEKSKWDNKANSYEKDPFIKGLCFFACGHAVTVEASDTDGKNKITWQTDTGAKSVEVAQNINIYGGGYGMEESVYYPATSVTMNSGKVNAIYGGGLSNCIVGSSTIIMNGGYSQNVLGGGAAYNETLKKPSANNTGHADIIINNDSKIFLLFGGGQSVANIGSVNVTINNGTVDYATAGGSNGTTGIGNVVVNNGTIKVLQGCNRGSVEDISITINGGTIGKVYAGGETEDSSVTATYTKSVMNVKGGNITKISAGTSGGVESSDKVSGTYVADVISDDVASTMNLTKITTIDELSKKLITSVALEDKVLVFKNGDTVISSVDLSSIVQ